MKLYRKYLARRTILLSHLAFFLCGTGFAVGNIPLGCVLIVISFFLDFISFRLGIEQNKKDV